MQQKIIALLLILSLLFAGCSHLPGYEKEKTVPFTDSLGRTVNVPERITKIAISGPLSQVYILPLAGDLLVGVSNAFAENAQKYLPEEILNKTEIGQLYGGKREMDLEALLAADPDVVIDIGQSKGSMVTDFDDLTQQTGIPFIHIDADIASAAEAYRTLGKLLGREEKAEALAAWCENTYDNILEIMEKVDADNARKTLLYCLGDTGTNVIAEGSFHAQIVNLMSQNAAVIDEVVSSGDGNQVDLEQILRWDPQVIVFAYGSCYDTVGADPQWQGVSAISGDTYYEAPYGPYGWLSSPPAVQSYLGMLWLGAVLYPDYVTYDLQKEITGYYELFYGCALTEEMYAELTQSACN